MYKVYLKGFFGVMELNRLFKSKFWALIFAELVMLRFNEICDYEIKEV